VADDAVVYFILVSTERRQELGLKAAVAHEKRTGRGHIRHDLPPGGLAGRIKRCTPPNTPTMRQRDDTHGHVEARTVEQDAVRVLTWA